MSASRQFGIGWSYNDSITSGAGIICPSPEVGKVRSVCAIRFTAARAAGLTLWWITKREAGGVGDAVVVASIVDAPAAATSFEVKGPIVIPAGWELIAGPVLTTADRGEFLTLYEER